MQRKYLIGAVAAAISLARIDARDTVMPTTCAMQRR